MNIELIIQKTRAELQKAEALAKKNPEDHEHAQTVKQLKLRLQALWTKLMALSD